MKKLLLSYNARVGRNPMAKIEEITKKIGVKIESIADKKPGHTVVSLTGPHEKLAEVDKKLLRFPSITRKAIKD